MSESNKLGPLPKVSPSHLQGDAGVSAFTRILSEDKFLIRKTLEKDYGVDVQIEAIFDSSATNFIAHVQVKTKAHSEFNTDGSLSLEVSSANLNYLLNSSNNCSFYVVYLTDLQQLRYAWAYEEKLRIEQEKPDWQNTNKQVTLRFINLLDEKAIREIHHRVIEKYEYHRTIADSLALKERSLKNPDEIQNLILDPRSKEVIDPNNLIQNLRQNGLFLVASDQWKIVLEQAQFLPTNLLEKDKKVQLVLAYANYCRGQFLQAKAHLTNCHTGNGAFDNYEQSLWSTLSNACGFHLGELSREEFLKRDSEITKQISDPVFKIQAEFYHLRLDSVRFFTQPSPDFSGEYQKLLKVAQILNEPLLELQGEVTRLEIEGQTYLRKFVEFIGTLAGQQNAFGKHILSTENVIAVTHDSLKVWERRISQLVGSTKGNFRLLADIIVTGGKIIFGLIFHSKIVGLSLSNFQLDVTQITPFLHFLRQAGEKFSELDMRYHAVQAKHLAAECFYFLGEKQTGQAIAKQVLPEAMQYSSIAKRLQNIIDENTDLEQVNHQAKKFKETFDEDTFLLGLDEEKLKQFSLHTAKIYEALPHQVERDLSVKRMAAQERKTWCQHIDIEPLGPNLWRCHCPKTGQLSSIPTSYIDSMMNTFKKISCAHCVFKKPRAVTL